MATYFIRQGDHGAQGPFDEARIAGYIAAGRVRPGMEIRPDGQRWMPVEEHRLWAAAPVARSPVAPDAVVEAVQEVEEVTDVVPGRAAHRPRVKSAPASGGNLKVIATVVGGLLAWVCLGCINEYFLVIPAIGVGLVRTLRDGEGIGQGFVAAVILGAGATAMRGGAIAVGATLLVLGLGLTVSMLDPAGP